MKFSPVEFTTGTEFLSQAMRAIRRKRGLRAIDVARQMAMPLRSYEHFEAGRGRVSFERIEAFAAATDSDPIALLFSMMFRSAEFAVNCMDSKLALVGVLALERFNHDLESDLTLLSPSNIVGAYERLFKDLDGQLKERNLYAERWMAERGSAFTRPVLRRRGRGAKDKE